jgi:hypothetical protein
MCSSVAGSPLQALHSQKSYPKVIKNIIQKSSSFFDFHNLQAEAEAHHWLVVLLGLTTPAMSIILASVVCYSFPLFVVQLYFQMDVALVGACWVSHHNPHFFGMV